MKKKKYLSVCHMLELECDFFGCFIPLYMKLKLHESKAAP